MPFLAPELQEVYKTINITSHAAGRLPDFNYNRNIQQLRVTGSLVKCRDPTVKGRVNGSLVKSSNTVVNNDGKSQIVTDNGKSKGLCHVM